MKPTIVLRAMNIISDDTHKITKENKTYKSFFWIVLLVIHHCPFQKPKILDAKNDLRKKKSRIEKTGKSKFPKRKSFSFSRKIKYLKTLNNRKIK